MALPPKGHPHRPLRLAVSSMRAIGVFLLLLSTCAGIGLIIETRASRPRAAGGMPITQIVAVILGMLFYLVPGVCFIVFSVYLAKRRHWAAIASIVLTSLVTIAVLGIASVLAFFGFAGEIAGGSEPSFVLLAFAGVLVLITLALGQLIYHLVKSVHAIRIDEPLQHGFEPLMAPPPPTLPMPGTLPANPAAPAPTSGASGPLEQ